MKLCLGHSETHLFVCLFFFPQKFSFKVSVCSVSVSSEVNNTNKLSIHESYNENENLISTYCLREIRFSFSLYDSCMLSLFELFTSLETEIEQSLSNNRVAHGGVVVSVLATGPKVRGFKPGRGRWTLRVIKSVARLHSEGK
jgi:hypothetical protein